MTISQDLARSIIDLDVSVVPDKVIRLAKYCLLDYIGVTVAHQIDESSRIILRYARKNRQRRGVTIIGTGIKTSEEHACLVNGALGHVLDFDDAMDSYFGHPSVVLYPLIIALGERYGFSRRRVLEAFIVGCEVASKIASISMPLHYRIGWHSTSTIGTFAATASACKLLKLEEKEITNALGIAGSLASGVRENFGTLTKPLHAGRAAQNGFLAALLARDGFTASSHIFEGNNGFLKLFAPKAEVSEISFQKRDGKFFLSDGVYFKLYPSCTETHPAIETALKIADKYKLSPEDVSAITCLTTQKVIDQVLENPATTGHEGRFCIPFCVANILVHGAVDASHFTEENVRKERIQDLMKKVEVKLGSPFGESRYGESSATTLKVLTKDGKLIEDSVEIPKGDPRNPLNEEELICKFKKCTSNFLGAENADLLVVKILESENTPNIRGIVKLLRVQEETRRTDIN